jgi:lipopolysaccharide transport system ATP-binding protein
VSDPNYAPSIEEFWALKGIDFEVKQGDVVGVIGRNGAGKSTLLKVLSRITEPTTGRVRIRGRVASLLEVGTGFHPELTGRENIYLNGAILGMARAEIRRKFDEIVAFAEVEKFLDTPVKRYSSGMYVRLAFGVAAHLEPEILVVDEVLAVGDAEFQKKCLGKMRDVSRGGRTVLFVSHNMAAVKSLTTRSILLRGGELIFDGTTDAAIHRYLKIPKMATPNASQRRWGRGSHTAILSVRILDPDGEPTLQYIPGQRFRVEIEFETDGTGGMSLDLFLKDSSRVPVGMASSSHFHGQMLPSGSGVYRCSFELGSIGLASGSYSLDVRTSIVNVDWDHNVEEALEFEVPFSNPMGREFDFKQQYGYGVVALLTSAPIQFEPIADVNGRMDSVCEPVEHDR